MSVLLFVWDVSWFCYNQLCIPMHADLEVSPTGLTLGQFAEDCNPATQSYAGPSKLHWV